MTSKRIRWALWAAGLTLAVPAYVATSHTDLINFSEAAATEQAAAPPPVPVTVEKVEPRRLSVWQDFSGRLEAVERVELRSQVSGAIQSVHFSEGGLVKAGDLLVTIDDAAYRAAVAQAEGQVASARARLDLAASEVERGKALFANKTIAKSDIAQRESTLAEAVAALKGAEANLAAARINLDHTRIRAPIAGRAGRLALTPGNLVAEGAASPALTTLVSVDPIYASFNVGEDVIARLLQKLPVRDGSPELGEVPVEILAAGEGPAARGKLQLVNNEVDEASGTVRVRAILDNPEGRLIPGQFVRIRLGEPGGGERLAISERAIGTDQDKKFVLLVDKANVATYRPIELGAAVDGGRIVESGLQAGDRIIVGGLQRVRPGATVAPEEKAVAAQ
jgi:multidrug efflux system membrane fusion protein